MCNEVDWLQVSRIEKDICYFYHEMSDYRYFMPDCDYGNLYTQPYWGFFVPPDLGNETRWEFVSDGCMVIVLGMLYDRIEGSGDCVSPYFAKIRVALDSFVPGEGRSAKLHYTLRLALRLADSEYWETHEGEHPDTGELDGLVSWVREEYIGRYFVEMARAEQCGA